MRRWVKLSMTFLPALMRRGNFMEFLLTYFQINFLLATLLMINNKNSVQDWENNLLLVQSPPGPAAPVGAVATRTGYRGGPDQTQESVRVIALRWMNIFLICESNFLLCFIGANSLPSSDWPRQYFQGAGLDPIGTRESEREMESVS